MVSVHVYLTFSKDISNKASGMRALWLHARGPMGPSPSDTV